MAQFPSFATPVALNANTWVPVEIGSVGMSKILLRLDAAAACYIAGTPSPGTAYWTIASGEKLELDLKAMYGGALIDTELLSNGTFTGSAAGWTLGTGWAYGTNTATKNADGTGTCSQTPTTDIIAGAIYKLVYTTSTHTVGSVVASVGATNGITCGSAQTVTEYIKATDTTGLVFTPTNTSRFLLDGVSLKRYAATYQLWAKAAAATPNLMVAYY